MSARIDILLLLPFALATGTTPLTTPMPSLPAPPSSFGYAHLDAELNLEEKFLNLPEAARAGAYLRVLTAEPHLAGSPEDHKAAEYVAQQFRAAGLETEIVPYRVLMSTPVEQRLEAWDDRGRTLLSGLTPEHLPGVLPAHDPRIPMPYSGASASGELTGALVYANYGRKEDFDLLAAQHVDLHGKIVLCRYGANFRGSKVYLAEQRGAAAVLLYSDPDDDGAGRGELWPYGPWRPETSVQSGSVQYLFRTPGDPETPGVASTPNLPDAARVRQFTGSGGAQPAIPVLPLSAADAAPLVAALSGPVAPEDWQGGFAGRYRIGGNLRVHLRSRQHFERRLIWNVIGKLRGTEAPEEWIVAGNHRDAWSYGAADPGSGTAAQLETVRALGTLVHQGWRPRRSLLIANWDAEEQGLIGSTEWVEDHPDLAAHAVAYFNMDVAVSGPNFSAAATPSLKPLLREVARQVPSPQGGTVYQQWRTAQAGLTPHAAGEAEVRIGPLGAGSDYTPFYAHAGVPSADISSDGPYGVYHSVFDNYDWYRQNADPHFAYLRQMAQFFGLAILRMDGATVLPYDEAGYAQEILAALETAHRRADDESLNTLDFAPARAAALRFFEAARALRALQTTPPAAIVRRRQIDRALRASESALLAPDGLPGRPWYRHQIFAPGQSTGYAAMVLPGLNEAIEARDPALAQRQIRQLALSLEEAAHCLESAR